jgi:hypothetical protein
VIQHDAHIQAWRQIPDWIAVGECRVPNYAKPGVYEHVMAVCRETWEHSIEGERFRRAVKLVRR